MTGNGADDRLVLRSDQLLPEGVHHWTATHPDWEGPVSAYAIDDGQRLILIDPIAVPDVLIRHGGERQREVDEVVIMCAQH